MEMLTFFFYGNVDKNIRHNIHMMRTVNGVFYILSGSQEMKEDSSVSVSVVTTVFICCRDVMKQYWCFIKTFVQPGR